MDAEYVLTLALTSKEADFLGATDGAVMDKGLFNYTRRLNLATNENIPIPVAPKHLKTVMDTVLTKFNTLSRIANRIPNLIQTTYRDAEHELCREYLLEISEEYEIRLYETALSHSKAQFKHVIRDLYVQFDIDTVEYAIKVNNAVNRGGKIPPAPYWIKGRMAEALKRRDPKMPVCRTSQARRSNVE